MDSIRRTILATGAAATALAAAPRVFGQQTGQAGAAVTFYEKGAVRIHFEEAGSGFPLLLIPGGGLNSTISFFPGSAPFNPIEEFKESIAASPPTAQPRAASPPGLVDWPWMRRDDQLGLMDHLGIDVHSDGLRIGPFGILRRAPDRRRGRAAPAQRLRPEMRDLFYETNRRAGARHVAIDRSRWRWSINS
jgi:hypothetical protein